MSKGLRLAPTCPYVSARQPLGPAPFVYLSALLSPARATRSLVAAPCLTLPKLLRARSLTRSASAPAARRRRYRRIALHAVRLYVQRPPVRRLQRTARPILPSMAATHDQGQ